MNKAKLILRVLWWISGAILLLLFSFWFLRSCYHDGCAHSRSVVSSRQGGHLAIIEDECCSTGCVVTIKVKEARLLSLPSTVFEYDETHVALKRNESWTHDPVVVWLSENELEITVDRIGHIERQLIEAKGIKIKYRIGIVDEKK